MSEWISVKDQVPDLEGLEDYRCSKVVIAFTGSRVYPRRYARNMYAKTEKGRAARWEDMTGHIAPEPTHWMPLPPPPAEGE